MKKYNIVEWIILLSPIIDVLTAISQRKLNIDLSMGLIIRGTFLFFMVMFLLVKSNFKHKKICVTYVLAVAIYSIIYMMLTYFAKGKVYMITEAKELIKAFYFPVGLVSMLAYFETKKDRVNPKILFCTFLGYVILLLIPSLFKIGYESYAEDKIGTIGWFFSANEISAIYAILFAFIVFSYDYIKNKIIYVLLISCSLYTVMQIGTKIPAIAALVAILAFIIVKSIQYAINQNREYIKTISIGILSLCIFTFVFFNSPVAINFDIYRDYLLKTQNTVPVENVDKTDSVTAGGIEAENTKEDSNTIQNETQKTTETILNNNELVQDNTESTDTELTGEQIATIIHSGRIETKNEIKNKFNKALLPFKLFGIGTIDNQNNSYYLCEIDYYDIFFNFGYLGFIVYFAPVVAIIGYIIMQLKHLTFKQIIYNNELCCYTVSIIIAVFLCAVGGHTLVAPAVSIYITIALIQSYLENRKDCIDI